MAKDIFADRQVMLDPYYEFYHYCDEIPPTVDFHQHSFYEIFFFLSGNVNYSIEGKIYRLRPGDILLTNNLDIHRPEISPGKPYERFVIWISDSFFDKIHLCGDDLRTCFSDAASKDYRLIRPDDANLLRLQKLCSQIEQALGDDSLGSRTIAASCLLRFLVYLSRCCEKPSVFMEDITENQAVNQALAYINENISRDLTLDELADYLFISKFHLCKQFKHFTGMSVYQYIMKKRLIISLNMLRRGVPVTNAYLECGFNDYSNYLKAFKREFGKNPKEFMKKGP